MTSDGTRRNSPEVLLWLNRSERDYYFGNIFQQEIFAGLLGGREVQGRDRGHEPPVHLFGKRGEGVAGPQPRLDMRHRPFLEKAGEAYRRMISGNAMKRSYDPNNRESRAVSFVCLGGPPEQPGMFNVNCPQGLRAQVVFPS